MRLPCGSSPRKTLRNQGTGVRGQKENDESGIGKALKRMGSVLRCWFFADS